MFIYGASGLGKTHILHAIGHYVYQNFPNLNVCYVSTETFLNEFIDSIRTHGQTAFKRRYRAYDVLLVDDIQLLEGKKETQEEFFYTFNSFYEAEKQIVISSDRHPRAIATLEDRLRSRFESGLITDIQPPELETRLAILRKKSEGEKVKSPRGRPGADRHLREGQHPRARRRPDTALRLRQHPPRPCHEPARLGGPFGRHSGQRTPPGDGQADPRGDGQAFDLTVEEICGPAVAGPCCCPPDGHVPVPGSHRLQLPSHRPGVRRSRPHHRDARPEEDSPLMMAEKRQVYDQVTDLIHKIKSAD